MVEEMLAARGIIVSHEIIRCWAENSHQPSNFTATKSREGTSNGMFQAAFWNQKEKELARSLELSSLPVKGALILASSNVVGEYIATLLIEMDVLRLLKSVSRLHDNRI